jgi:hypothetical protein
MFERDLEADEIVGKAKNGNRGVTRRECADCQRLIALRRQAVETKIETLTTSLSNSFLELRAEAIARAKATQQQMVIAITISTLWISILVFILEQMRR